MLNTQYDLYSMTTEQERDILYNLTKNLNLSNNGSILEFGVYFGGSLEAIVKGVQENQSFSNNKVIAIDAFATVKDGAFAKLVLQDAKANKVENLLKITEDTIDWKNIPERQFSEFDNVILLQTKIENYSHTYGKIALIHFDLPKFFDDLESILNKCMNDIQKDTVFIFQDFFYHWSAEIIAFIYYLLKTNTIEFVYGVSSSLICKNISLTTKQLEEFKQILQQPDLVLELLEQCHIFLKEKNFCGARVIFAEEFYLAIIQYAALHNFDKIRTKYQEIFSFIQTSYGEKMYRELLQYDFNAKESFKREIG
jgi:hypothetical protein